ncbi:Protein NBR1 homolog [Linum perenne]
MASTLVIKARHGDTLRRFNVAIRDDGQLSLDMEELRVKILGLFNIPLKSDIELSYVDEDGDVVALVDDYDLQDIMRQNLNFLKVGVGLEHANYGWSNSAALGASYPFRSPPINETLSKAVSDCPLNSTPEAVSTGALINTGPPLCEALSKLSMELASENASSTLVTMDQKPLVATNVSTQTGAKSVPTAPFVVPYVPAVGSLHETVINCNAPSKTTLDEHWPRLPNPINLNQDPLNGSSPLGGLLGNSLQPLVNKRPIGEAGKESIPVPEPNSTYVPVPLHLKQAKSCHSQNDGLIGLLRPNIICNGCGVVPIAGPRYKSKVEEDYDLCSVCFANIGNGAGYIKMNTPMSAQHSQSSRSLHDFVVTSLLVPNICVFPPGRSALLKLDSCFVLDVNVEDGTLMAPSTKFTKIWRMQNTGVVAWPLGTCLVQIGGDKFSHKDRTNLEIPAHGVPVDAELDVSIDFTSPAYPGQYISSWRMASPYGTHFGQCIWVHIQVDASLNESFGGSFCGFNLNLLPEYDEPKCPETLDVNRTAVAAAAQSCSSAMGSSDSAPRKSLGTVEGSELERKKGVDDEVEKLLLKNLEEMGFKQINLNKEILRLNQYDLEQSLNDLCGVADWDDSTLQELEEMGFCDKKLNKMLLKKNNGSIKRVVMDLLRG